MKDVVMQFPNVNGSSLYNGRGHFIVPVDVVKIGNTNVYVFEYDDLSSKKRSRALVQKTVRGLSHIPLMNKTGLNQLFEKNLGGRVSIKSFMEDVVNIGVTRMYQDLPTFLTLLSEEKKAIVNNTDDIANAVVRGRKLVRSGMTTPNVVVHEDQASKWSASRQAAAAAAAQEAAEQKSEQGSKPTPPPQADNSRGDLGFWSTNPAAAMGPGRQNGWGSPMGIRTGGFMGPMMGPPPGGGPDGPGDDAPSGPKL